MNPNTTVWDDYVYAPSPVLTPKSLEQQRLEDGVGVNARTPYSPEKRTTIEFDLNKGLHLGEKTITPGVLDDALAVDWVSSWAAHELKMRGIAQDPAYLIDKKRFVDVDSKSINEEFHEDLLTSRSQGEYEQRLQYYREQTTRLTRLQEAGWGGTFARLFSNVFDPTVIGATVASEGILAPAILAAKATRLGNIVRHGLLAGASNAAAEAGASTVNPLIGWQDVGTAFGMGLAFGGAFGALRGNTATIPQANQLHSIGTSAVAANNPATHGALSKVKFAQPAAPVSAVTPSQTGLNNLGQAGKAMTSNMYDALWRKVESGDITENGQPSALLQAANLVRKAGGLKSQAEFEALAKDYALINRGPDFQKEMQALVANHMPQGIPSGMGGSVGAAQNVGSRPAIGNTATYLEQADVPRSALDKARFDAVGRQYASDAPVHRLQVGHLLDDGVSARGDGASPMSASLKMQRGVLATYSRWFKLSKPEFNAWADEQGHKWWWQKMRAKGEFMYRVGEFVENEDTLKQFHPKVAAVGERYRSMMADFLAEAQRLQIPGFENLPPNKFYMPKYLNRDGNIDLFNAAANGWSDYIPVVKAAIQKALPTIDNDLLQRFAFGYMQRLSKASYGMEDGIMGLVGKADSQTLYSRIKATLGDSISDADAMLLSKEFQSSPSGSGLDARTKHRAKVDYNVETPVVMKDGSTKMMSLRKFFETDAESTLLRYARQMHGRLALADTVVRAPDGSIIQDGIRSYDDIVKMKDRVAEDYQRLGIMKDRLDQDKDFYDFAWFSVTGQLPDGKLEIPAKWRGIARRIQEFNFVRLMNNMGVNQAMELVNIPAQLGLRAMIQGIPEIGRILKGGEKVKKDEIVRDLQVLLGLGEDTLYSRHAWRYDHDRIGEVADTSWKSRFGMRFDQAMTGAKEVTNTISAMKYVNAGLQQWAMKAAAQRFANLAKKWEKAGSGDPMAIFKGKDAKRIRSIGYTSDELKKLFTEINGKVTTHSEFGRLKQMNFDQWDPNVKSQFADALFRMTGRMVQTNDSGNLAMWMSSSMGKMAIQFKSFMFAAYTKQTLHGLAHMDPRQFMQWNLQLLAGSLTYYLMNKPLEMVSGDPIAFAEDRLTAADVIKAGFARAPFASILPTAVDTVIHTGRMAGVWDTENQFNYRTSGTAMDLWLGNPATDAFNSALKFSEGLIDSSSEGREMAQNEIKAGNRAFMPHGNWLPWTILYSYMIRDRNKTPSQQ